MWWVILKAKFVYKMFGKDALDVWLTDLEMKWLGPRSRLTDDQKREAKALLERIQERHGLARDRDQED